jgi:hypothetical protein
MPPRTPAAPAMESFRTNGSKSSPSPVTHAMNWQNSSEPNSTTTGVNSRCATDRLIANPTPSRDRLVEPNASTAAASRPPPLRTARRTDRQEVQHKARLPANSRECGRSLNGRHPVRRRADTSPSLDPPSVNRHADGLKMTVRATPGRSGIQSQGESLSIGRSGASGKCGRRSASIVWRWCRDPTSRIGIWRRLEPHVVRQRLVECDRLRHRRALASAVAVVAFHHGRD